MQDFIMLLIMVTAILVVSKLIFCELDGRRANKQYNLRYFLNFSNPFKYGKVRSMAFMAFLCFILFSDIKLFSVEGIFFCSLFLVSSIIMDIISQYAYYLYGKNRFKTGIQKANDVRNRLIQATNEEDLENIIYPIENFNYEDICEIYFQEDQHIAISSMDGGEFVSHLDHLPYVTFVIDHFEQAAKELLASLPVKVTNLTNTNGLPFKDDKLDMYVVNYSNFDKKDVYRVLKNDGLLILRHKGSNDLKEFQINLFNKNNVNQWNVDACSGVLSANNFQIIDRKEVNGKVEFLTTTALITYLRKNNPGKKINIDVYLNQLAFIDANIRQKGKYALTLHEFYVVARK